MARGIPEHTSNVGVGVEPVELARLRAEIGSARGAFDDGHLMTPAHRERVVQSIEGEVADAACRAARAGHGRQALDLLLEAAASPLRWRDLGVSWERIVDVATEAVATWFHPETERWDDLVVTGVRG